jgi:hypothetical protein
MINPKRSAAEIGKANLEKSKIAERAVVSYLRAHGWPGAERTVRTGYRVAGRASRDQGDVDGAPGLAWQVKTTTANAEPMVRKWLAETEDQRAAAGADLGLLVVKRIGATDPGRWWSYLRLDALAQLLARITGPLPPAGPVARLAPLGPATVRLGPCANPVRLELAVVVDLLRHAGYGSPPEEYPPSYIRFATDDEHTPPAGEVPA